MTIPAELYACLYAREFPAQALLRLRPELRDKACVVLEGEPPTQQVCSLNTRARLLGITQGMTKVEVETFPDAIILARSSKTEAAVQSVLLECAGTFSPRIEGRSERGAFVCCIDIAGTSGLFGSPGTLARTLVQRVRLLGISASVVVSRNVPAAISMARGLAPSLAVKVIQPGDEANALQALPLRVLDLSEAQSETFALWGIHTLGMLAALPEEALIARMGQHGKRLRLQARGEMKHLFQPGEATWSLEERMELDSPVDQLDALLFATAVLLDQLLLRAKARVLALASVTTTLVLENKSVHVRTVRPALPSTDKQLWLKLIHLDLEAHPPQDAIVAFSLHAEPGSSSKVQLGLFSPQVPEASRLDVTLARIRALVGDECVGRAVLQDTRAPESFRMEPFTVPDGESDAAPAPHTRTSKRQLRPAEAISVTVHDQTPAAFYFRERRYTVERAYGPWLMSGDWWNGSLWGQEQWDLIARTQDGTLLCCCTVRDPMLNRWQMAALYD